MRLRPLSLPLQLLCLLAYLAFVFVFPHYYGTRISHPDYWPWARLTTTLSCLLLLLVVLLLGNDRPRESRWQYGLLGAALPLFTTACVGSLYVEALLIAIGWSSPPYANYDADASRYYVHYYGALLGSALTYSWLALNFASITRRWWSAILVGFAALLAMLLLDGFVVFLATVGLGKLG